MKKIDLFQTKKHTRSKFGKPLSETFEQQYKKERKKKTNQKLYKKVKRKKTNMELSSSKKSLYFNFDDADERQSAMPTNKVRAFLHIHGMTGLSTP